jgi:hypothetical protein
MDQTGYNTNLAAEFYVLATLYRKGYDAHLTLGNKKSVDIVIEREKGRQITVDVKGIAGTSCWFMDNAARRGANHYFILVSFLNKIKDHAVVPECWIIPSKKIDPLLHCNEKGKNADIHRSHLLKLGKKYRENWKLIR